MKTLLFIVISLIILQSCNNSSNNSENLNNNDTIVQDEQTIISELTDKISTLLKNNDLDKFAEFIHPIKGLRFTAYAQVDTVHDIKLLPNDFKNNLKSNNKLHWGIYDGSGDSIVLNIPNYFKEFVYNADFLHAEKKNFNKIESGGSIPSNLVQVYKNNPFVECYFSAIDKQFEGLDWCALQYVFEKHENTYYLVGIIHNQWTI